MTPRTPKRENDLLPINDDSTSNFAELSTKRAHAEQELLKLKRKQEEYERQAQELESLEQRRNLLVSGQKDMLDKFTRAITLLERSTEETERQLQDVKITLDSFNNHLNQVSIIDPNNWPQDTKLYDQELSKALSKVEHAKSIYNQARSKIQILNNNDFESDTETDDNWNEEQELAAVEIPFTELLRRGFALSLPLILFLSVVVFIILTQK